MPKSVIVEYKDGRAYAVTSAAKARSVHPDATIVGHEDGTPFETTKTANTAKTPAKKSTGKKPKVASGVEPVSAESVVAEAAG